MSNNLKYEIGERVHYEICCYRLSSLAPCSVDIQCRRIIDRLFYNISSLEESMENMIIECIYSKNYVNKFT